MSSLRRLVSAVISPAVQTVHRGHLRRGFPVLTSPTLRGMCSDEAKSALSAAPAPPLEDVTSFTPASGAPLSALPGVTHGDAMLMLYTCKVCETRSARKISKLAYNTGVVMVRCYGCDNLHLIADRLNWFDEGSVDVHDLIARYGSAEEAAASDGSVKTSLQLTPADIEVLNREIKDRAAAIAAEKAAAASKLENT